MPAKFGTNKSGSNKKEQGSAYANVTSQMTTTEPAAFHEYMCPGCYENLTSQNSKCLVLHIRLQYSLPCIRANRCNLSIIVNLFYFRVIETCIGSFFLRSEMADKFATTFDFYFLRCVFTYVLIIGMLFQISEHREERLSDATTPRKIH